MQRRDSLGAEFSDNLLSDPTAGLEEKLTFVTPVLATKLLHHSCNLVHRKQIKSEKGIGLCRSQEI